MQFDNPSIRLNTFSNWPIRTRVWPQQLSKAGFYFTGKGTCVKCFSCGICTSVDDWNARDLPEMVHVKLNNACEFIKEHFSHIINKIEKDETGIRKGREFDETHENRLSNEPSYQESLAVSELAVQNGNSRFSQTTDLLQKSLDDEGRNNTNFVDYVRISEPTVRGTVGFSGTCIRQDSTKSIDALNQGKQLYCTNASITINNPKMPFNTIERSTSQTFDRTNSQKIVHQNEAVDYGHAPNHSYDVDHPTTGLVNTSQEPEFAFPNFKWVERRQASFKTWPKTAKQSSNLLARGGFFYKGVDDVVRCFCCNLGLSEWAETDEPWIEHARHNPKCWFLRLQKGETFINNIQEDWKKRYKPRNPAFDDIATRLATFDGWRNVQQTPEMLADAGFFFTGEDDTVRCHYCDGGLRNWKDGDIPWEEHARWFPSCKFVIKMKGMTYIDSTRAKYQDQSQTASVKNSRKEDSDLSNLRSTNNEMKSNLVCVLCKKNERCMLFTNCGHRVTCEQCCGSIVVCPYCNKRIKKAIKTFLS